MKKIIALCTLTTTFYGAAMESTKAPKKLYKIVSLEQWEQSKGKENIVLSNMDKDFIHFSSNEEQVNYVVNKFWKNKSYILLTIDTEKTPGSYKHEYNQSKTDQFWHLYNGAIPHSAIINKIEANIESEK